MGRPDRVRTDKSEGKVMNEISTLFAAEPAYENKEQKQIKTWNTLAPFSIEMVTHFWQLIDQRSNTGAKTFDWAHVEIAKWLNAYDQ